MLSGLPRAHGFTLIELLVAMTVLAVLIGLGAPSLSTYLQNSKVSSSAQSLYSGLQLARTEAIRRNLPVEFVLTNSSVAASGVADSVVPAVAGQSWLVRAPLPPDGTNFELVDAKAAAESGAGGAVRLAASAPGGFTGAIAFNGFGGTAAGLSYVLDVTNPGVGACVEAGGPVRCKRVRVSPGGQIMACDPAVTSETDSRHC